MQATLKSTMKSSAYLTIAAIRNWYIHWGKKFTSGNSVQVKVPSLRNKCEPFEKSDFRKCLIVYPANSCCFKTSVFLPMSQKFITKLDLEKEEEQEVKLPTSVGSSKKQERSRKTSTFASLTMPKPLTVGITADLRILQEMGITDPLPASWEICMQVKKQ